MSYGPHPSLARVKGVRTCVDPNDLDQFSSVSRSTSWGDPLVSPTSRNLLARKHNWDDLLASPASQNFWRKDTPYTAVAPERHCTYAVASGTRHARKVHTSHCCHLPTLWLLRGKHSPYCRRRRGRYPPYCCRCEGNVWRESTTGAPASALQRKALPTLLSLKGRHSPHCCCCKAGTPQTPHTAAVTPNSFYKEGTPHTAVTGHSTPFLPSVWLGRSMQRGTCMRSAGACMVMRQEGSNQLPSRGTVHPNATQLGGAVWSHEASVNTYWTSALG